MVDKGKVLLEKGKHVHLDSIYDIQGLIPSGSWVNEYEFEEFYGEKELNKVLNGSQKLGDDGVIFLKNVLIEYKVKSDEE